MDFERARFNMVEQQIRPAGVLDQDILDLLFLVRREEFVPPAYRTLAFTDMELPLTIDGRSTGERMFAPKIEAHFMQALAVKKHESVLEVGAGSGYMAALLAHRARHVETVDVDPSLARFAAANLQRAGITNAVAREGDGSRPGHPPQSFDVVMLSGAVSFLPDFILALVKPGGRVAAIVGEPPALEAQVATRVTDKDWRTVTLFETSAKPLAGFPVLERFRF